MGCSSKSHKTCHDKSCQRYYNNNVQAIAAGQTVQLAIAGARVVDSGIAIDTQPLSYTTLKTGLYHIAADVVVNATTAGSGVFQVYMDGVPLPCTRKTVQFYSGGTAVHTETDLELSGCCCNVEHSFTFIFTSDTVVGSVTEFCSGVLKLA